MERLVTVNRSQRNAATSQQTETKTWAHKQQQQQQQQNKKPKTKNRLYNERYVSYSFSEMGQYPTPESFICSIYTNLSYEVRQ